MILVTNNIHLSPTSVNDADALVKWLQDKEIADNALAIPYPYTLQHARTWLEDNQIFEEENGFNPYFAIRISSGELIGVIDLHTGNMTRKDKAEFGYWLCKPYWNKGIMTSVILKFCEVAREQFGVRTLEAFVFTTNPASQKVLLKAGFTQGETIPGKFTKTGKKIDGVKFVKEL
jgi:RimJ/RimL family protein N-acetyltransferase